MIDADTNTLQIALLGECMVEYIQHDEAKLRQGYAGDTYNTAVYMRRLLDVAECKVSYVTALGDDAVSQDMLSVWQTEQLDTQLVASLKGESPGSYTIKTDRFGERRFEYNRAHAAVTKLFATRSVAALLASLENYQFLYLSGISIAIFDSASREHVLALVKAANARGIKIIFDSNYRASLWRNAQQAREYYEKIYPYVETALVSYGDELAIFTDLSPEHTCQRIAAYGVREIVVKNAADPCTVQTELETKTYPVKQLQQQYVQDTTAAGDSFNAAYISARLHGYDVATAIAAAQSLSAHVVQFPGAIIPPEQTPVLAELINHGHAN